MYGKKLYFSYAIIGIFYLLVKIIFVSFGYLHPGAITHGAIPAVLTILAGLFAIRETGRNHKRLIWNWLMLIFPILVFVTTPPYMYLKAGEMWLSNGRLPVLIIYEVLALAQFIISLVNIKRLRLNR